MNARFSKWGNSLAVRVPASLAQEIAVGEGDPADIVVENGNLVIKPVHSPRYDLSDLIGKITEANVHDEAETGSAVGNEFW
jgi:antitoxin MazE